MRGRKRGCPTSVKDWQIDIMHPFESRWVRIRGLTQITRSHDTTTEDGGGIDSDYEEPYVKKRSGALALEGKLLADEITGQRDEGQELLNEYAKKMRCDGDALIRITDAYGHSMQAYYVVSGTEDSADDAGSDVSWDLEMVGEPETLVYVTLDGITLMVNGAEATTINIDLFDAPRVVRVVFDPADASNKRYRVSTSGRVVHAGSFAENTFTLLPLKVGTGSVKVSTVSGAREAAFTVNVTNELVPYKSAELGVGVLGAMVLGRSNLSA